MTEVELTFDEEVVCTKLAKDYLNKVTQFGAIGLTDSDEYEYNEFNNKIYYTQYPFRSIGSTVGSDSNSTSYKLLDLAEKMYNNSDLFSQLEFLIRKIPVTDTKNVDLKLITQNLLRQYNLLIKEERYMNCINIGDDTPLFHLGLFACKKNEDIVTICCTKMTVAVCSLFVQLCKDADFGDKVQLAITKISFPPCIGGTELPGQLVALFFDANCPYEGLPRWDAGCVGVVSARADVDSAVDTFLFATTRYPWKLKKIYVQEPAIERFRQAMKWKQSLHSPGTVHERIRDSCVAAYCLRAQLFLDEYVGNESFDDKSNVVLIEVYRTVKEVISLTNATSPFALSLWCTDVAESNEIATKVSADVVWVNGHGSFDGPPLASAPVYDTDVSLEVKSDMDAFVSEHRKVIEAWLKLEPMQRMLKIQDLFEKCKRISVIKDFRDMALGFDATVDAGRNLCIVTRKAMDKAFIGCSEFCYCYQRYLKYIAEGGVVILFNVSSNQNFLLTSLLDLGVPIYISQSKKSLQTKLYSTKVIWTSVGTIFAN